MSDCSKTFPCDSNGKSSENCYAKAYILPQEYENLFSVNAAFKKGTIFKDLYRPYYTKKDNTKDNDKDKYK